MDGDIFGRTTKIGRAAADAVWRALNGGAWDPFHALRCIDVLVQAANGIPSLPTVLTELCALRDAPLLAPLERDRAIAVIHAASCMDDRTLLDLKLRSCAEIALLRGEYEPRKILATFVLSLLESAVLTPKGGFIEQHGIGRLRDARTQLSEVAVIAADVLAVNPTAKRLGLARPHADLDGDSNLLGGV